MAALAWSRELVGKSYNNKNQKTFLQKVQSDLIHPRPPDAVSISLLLRVAGKVSEGGPQKNRRGYFNVGRTGFSPNDMNDPWTRLAEGQRKRSDKIIYCAV